MRRMNDLEQSTNLWAQQLSQSSLLATKVALSNCGLLLPLTESRWDQCWEFHDMKLSCGGLWVKLRYS